MTMIYNSLNYSFFNDVIVGREAVSGGSEFHAAIELGKNELWNCKERHWMGITARLCTVRLG